MGSNLQTALILGTIALVTAFTRVLPYALFGGRRALPEMVRYLGQVLPCAIMVILVVYCLRNLQLGAYPHGLPALISAALVAGLQLWRKNALVSIVAGTACYMLLLRLF